MRIIWLVIPGKSELNGMEFEHRNSDIKQTAHGECVRRMQTRDGCIFQKDLKIVYEIVMMSTAWFNYGEHKKINLMKKNCSEKKIQRKKM